MKIETYQCDQCENEIPNKEYLEISTRDNDFGFNVTNTFHDGKNRYFGNYHEMHFCSPDCMVTKFFGQRKNIVEPLIEGVDIGSTEANPVLEAKIIKQPDIITEDLEWNSNVDSSDANVDSSDKETPQPKKGWPKGKPRGSSIAKNFKREKAEVEPAPESAPAVENVPEKVKGKGRRTQDNDIYFQKLQFAKSIGYESISAALADMERFDFDKRFEKSEFSK